VVPMVDEQRELQFAMDDEDRSGND
jgi:hypothetical protein